MQHILRRRDTQMFVLLGGFFLANALIAEIIGVKIFVIDTTAQLGRPLQFTAGVLLWPLVFTVSDVVNEYFGRKGVQFLSYLTAALIGYAFVVMYVAIRLPPADWWPASQQRAGVPDMQLAYASLFGQSNWIIVASLVAFLLGQLVDVLVFHRIRKLTGERYIWLRALGSTAISQLIDSFVVLYIAFVMGPQHWGFDLFISVGTINFCYKMVVAILLVPALYGVHWAIDRYLGPVLAHQLKMQAAHQPTT